MALRVYKSSAGSGKTFTLVLEYLGLVIENPSNFRNILGVTFTNKAANELKSRVIHALWVLSSSDGHFSHTKSILINALHQRFGYADTLITENAPKAFSAILHNYSDFNISTIDSFVYGLVRTFTRELGLPSQFEIELEDEQMAAIINYEIIDRIGIDESISNALLSWVLSKMNDDGSWSIETDLRAFIKELLKERSFLVKRDAEILTVDDFTEVRKILQNKIGSFETDVIFLAKQFMQLLDEASIDKFELYRKASGIGKVFFELSKGNNVSENLESKTLIQILEGSATMIPKSANASLKASYALIESRVDEILEQFSALMNASYKIYKFYLLLQPSLYVFSLSESIRSIMQEVTREQQIVHISEFNKRIADLVAGAAVPYIYERIGERYHHYLIDEFQDTSILQWRNFLPLIDNALSQGFNSLIVGDAKQAIYRFRGGEVGQFIELPKIYQKNDSPGLNTFEAGLTRFYEPFILNVNYRSARSIVDFNNRFFSFIQQLLPESFQKVYDEQQQQIKENAEAGLVQITFLNDEAASSDQDVVLENIVSTINDARQDGFIWQDIAILVRKNEMANHIAQNLSNLLIPVVSSDSLLLSSSSKVRFIVSFLRFYVQPWDAVNRLELLDHLVAHHFVSGNIDLEQQLGLLAGLPEIDAIDYIRRLSRVQFGLLDGLGCYEMVSKLMAHFELDVPIDPYLVFFLQEIYRFEQKPQSGIDAFLNHWTERLGKSSLAVPESINAVRIMTIHKAKGLEFPVVIYPYADSYLDNAKQSNEWIEFGSLAIGKLQSGLMKIKKDFLQTPFDSVYLEDESKRKLDIINLLYVVLTRASSRLYVLVKPKHKSASFAVPVFFEMFLKQAGIWDAEKNTYTFGEATLQKVIKKPVQQELQSHFAGVQSDWSERVGFRSPEIDLLGLDVIGPASRGTTIHAFLSEINSIVDFDRLLDQYYSLGLLSEVDTIMLRHFSEQIEKNPSIKACFSGLANVRTEAAFVAQNGELLRLDRINRFEDQIVIIDYKTGTKRSDDVAQMDRYKSEISQLEHLPVTAFLIYLADPFEIVQL